MVKNRRIENRANIAARDIAENYAKLEEVLDILINAMDEKKKVYDTRKEQEKK